MITYLLRAVALFWAVATATLPGVLAVAEGVGEPAVTRGTAHVELPGGSDSCPELHGTHCAICTMLRQGHAGPREPAPVWDTSHPTGAAPQALAFAADSRVPASGSPRAPPAA